MSLTKPRIWLFITVAALCGLHAWMAASVSRTFSCTADEIAHLTSGYAYWTLHDYRFQPENGILPQRLAALPLLWQDVQSVPDSSPDWANAYIWHLGYIFFYKLGNDTATMMAAGRTVISCLSALLCFVIFLWSRSLFGWRGGLLSLGLAAFAPELLAHGGLMTSDSAAALGFTAAVLSWWRLLHRGTLGRLLTAGLCVGMLAVSKHSVVLFAPISLMMITVRLIRPAPLVFNWRRRCFRVTKWGRVPASLGLLAVCALICTVVIWSAYGFRYQAPPPGQEDKMHFIHSWPDVLMEAPTTPAMQSENDDEYVDHAPGVVQSFVRFSRDHRLLPEAWLYGLAFVEKNARSRLAYFAGDYRRTGWVAFFPVAFVLKTTLPALALIALGVSALASTRSKRRTVWGYRISPLLILLAVYWAFSLQSKLNIGHRHILPTYPACYILAGAGVLLIRRHRVWAVALTGLLALHIGTSLIARPDYLAYFNPLAGGRSQANRLFIDSSLDWGQDLPRLHKWIDAHASGEKIFLSYFGSGSPAAEGIESIRVGDGIFDWESRITPPPLAGGVYCISATMFRRVYTSVRGPWTRDYETRYRDIGDWIAHMGRKPAGQEPSNLDGTPISQQEAHDLLFEYEQLQFGRLCHFLQFRQPDAMVGYSFLIFRLNDNEITLALKAPLPVLNAYLLNYSSPRP
jgi:hypothetical protein